LHETAARSAELLLSTRRSPRLIRQGTPANQRIEPGWPPIKGSVSRTLLTPKLAAFGKIAMGITMGYMPILMV
jgi:hypothetical protein